MVEVHIDIQWCLKNIVSYVMGDKKKEIINK